MGMKFKNLPPITDEEEAEIQRHIASDPDAPEATDKQRAQAKPFKEAFPDLYESIQRSRGRPKSDDPKQVVTLRLPRTVLERWQRNPDWRTHMTRLLEAAAPEDDRLVFSAVSPNRLSPPDSFISTPLH